MEKNNTGDVTMMESVLDAAVQAPETEAAALSEAINELNPAATGEANQQGTEEVLEEPTDKGLRGRMHQFEQRGYKKGAREAEAKWATEKKELLERIAKHEAENLRREAKDFAQKHNMSEELAFKYLSLEKGSQISEQPRDDNGRFASKASETEPVDNDVRARAVTLMAQAEAFEKMTDGAVTKDQILDSYQNDPDVQQKVASGEWDFTDVGKHLRSPQKQAPKVARTTSGGQVPASFFSGMSDAEYAKFNEKIRMGAVFDARR